MLECVINISEGRDQAVLDLLQASVDDSLLDVHTDEHHNRAVFTLAGLHVQDAARRLATSAIAHLDLTTHEGVHPRIGVVDVVPFVPLPATSSSMTDAVVERNAFARWIAETHEVPAFLYGDERSLPEVRRSAFVTAGPDMGPPTPHSTAGAVAVGARPILVAFNIWLATDDLARARDIARAVRTTSLRTLGLQVGNRVQVSCNLIDPENVGPADAFDAVAAHAEVAGCELVGLIPRSVLALQPRRRWSELDLDEDKTIEARLSLR